MLPLFAALPDTNSHEALGWAIAIFFVIVTGLSSLTNLAGNIKAFIQGKKPTEISQPIEVQHSQPPHEKYATKEEMAQFERRVGGEYACLQTGLNNLRKDMAKDGEERSEKLAGLIEIIRQEAREDRKEAKEDRKGIYNRINATDAVVNGIQGELRGGKHT